MHSINRCKPAACSVCRSDSCTNTARGPQHISLWFEPVSYRLRSRGAPVPAASVQCWSTQLCLALICCCLSVCLFDELLIISSVLFTGPWNGDWCRQWQALRLTLGRLAYLQTILTESACFTTAAHLCHWHINTEGTEVRNWSTGEGTELSITKNFVYYTYSQTQLYFTC